jgi:DNA-binding NarL/FixJ family response regulator
MFGATLLTRREHEVVQHLLHGTSAPGIASRLHVSLQTVRVHRRNIYAKLDVSSLGQLFALAMNSLLEPLPGDYD